MTSREIKKAIEDNMLDIVSEGEFIDVERMEKVLQDNAGMHKVRCLGASVGDNKVVMLFGFAQFLITLKVGNGERTVSVV